MAGTLLTFVLGALFLGGLVVDAGKCLVAHSPIVILHCTLKLAYGADLSGKLFDWGRPWLSDCCAIFSHKFARLAATA